LAQTLFVEVQHRLGDRHLTHSLLEIRFSLTPLVVSGWLVRIFPSIRSLSCYCAEEMMRKRWEEVLRDLLVCQEIFRITQGTGKRLSTVFEGSGTDTFPPEATPVP